MNYIVTINPPRSVRNQLLHCFAVIIKRAWTTEAGENYKRECRNTVQKLLQAEQFSLVIHNAHANILENDLFGTVNNTRYGILNTKIVRNEHDLGVPRAITRSLSKRNVTRLFPSTNTLLSLTNRLPLPC